MGFLSEITGAEEELSSTIKTVAYVDGKLYGYASFGGVKSRYFVIDEYNKKLEYCGKFNKLLPRSLAYDYTENTLYAIAYSMIATAVMHYTRLNLIAAN